MLGFVHGKSIMLLTPSCVPVALKLPPPPSPPPPHPLPCLLTLPPPTTGVSKARSTLLISSLAPLSGLVPPLQLFAVLSICCKYIWSGCHSAGDSYCCTCKHCYNERDSLQILTQLLLAERASSAGGSLHPKRSAGTVCHRMASLQSSLPCHTGNSLFKHHA